MEGREKKKPTSPHTQHKQDMSSNKKGAQDYSEEVEEGVGRWRRVATEEKKLPEAIEGLFALEKKCRVGEDHVSGAKVASEIVQLCFQAKDFEAFKSNLVLISKKRGQVKSVLYIYCSLHQTSHQQQFFSHNNSFYS